jgi:hypothetical protein
MKMGTRQYVGSSLNENENENENGFKEHGCSVCFCSLVGQFDFSYGSGSFKCLLPRIG